MDSTSISFHFNSREPVTNAPPNIDNIIYDAVVQVEWDSTDTHINSLIENDINKIIHNKNLSWIHTVKLLVSSKLNLHNKTPLYMSYYKVMDGILNCYVTIHPNDNVDYDVIIDEHNNIGFKPL